MRALRDCRIACAPDAPGARGPASRSAGWCGRTEPRARLGTKAVELTFFFFAASENRAFRLGLNPFFKAQTAKPKAVCFGLYFTLQITPVVPVAGVGVLSCPEINFQDTEPRMHAHGTTAERRAAASERAHILSSLTLFLPRETAVTQKRPYHASRQM